MTVTARLLMFLAVIAAGAAGLGFLRCEGKPPELALEGPIWLGAEPREIAFTAHDPGSGLRHLQVILETTQGERTVLETRAQGGWLLGTAGSDDPTWSVRLSGQGLPEGEGKLRIRATDWSWAKLFEGNSAEVAVPLIVDTQPPRIRIENGLTYVKRAGSAAVSYRLDGPAALDGVRVGDRFFRGFPASATNDRRIAVFAVPRDVVEAPKIRVVASDLSGNSASRDWDVRFQDREFARVPVRLPERFFEEKVPELAADLGIAAGDVVAAFREINEGVRAANEELIGKVTRSTLEPRHFLGAFQQMRNSKVTSRFAEARSYRYGGEEVSRAVHYGYDLASTSHATVGASNAGRVIFAEDLGIYGHCVIIDHGLGVTSLYGHLSEIDVAVGDLVERGEALGRSGSTGLAGGDHLHFAILVGGVYVDPLEWWDARWVRERVEARALGATP